MKNKIIFAVLLFICISLVIFCLILTFNISYKSELIEQLRTDIGIEREIIDSIFLNPSNFFNFSNSSDDIIYLKSSDSIKEIQDYREYDIKVGFTDVSEYLKKSQEDTNRTKRLVKLGSVMDIEVAVFYSPSKEPNLPPFITMDIIRENKLDFSTFKPDSSLSYLNCNWELYLYRRILLDGEMTYKNFINNNSHTKRIIPVYPNELQIKNGPLYKSKNNDSVLYFLKEEDLNWRGDKIKLGVFRFVFTPPHKAGYYKIFVSSRTSKIWAIMPINRNINSTIQSGSIVIKRTNIKWYLDKLYTELKKFNVPYFDIKVNSQNIFSITENMSKQYKKLMNYADSTKQYSLRKKLFAYSFFSQIYSRSSYKISYRCCNGELDYNIKVVIDDI